MAENRHHDSRHEHDFQLPDLSKPEQRHEHRDVNVWAIGKFGVAFVILSIFTVGLMVGLFQYLLHREGGAPPTRVEMPATDARQLPPEPRLEENPVSDLKEMRAAEDKVLGSYGWIDEKGGVVRIPIDRAMELLAQRGLPSRPSGEGQSASRAAVPTESGMGEIMTQAGGPLASQAAAAVTPAASPAPAEVRK